MSFLSSLLKDAACRFQRANEVDMKAEMEAHNIPCTLIKDSAVGYILESVDCVMLGAEGVVESGGIINKVGDPQNKQLRSGRKN